jgi:hypothetical protein
VKPLRRCHMQAGEAGEALLCGSLRPPGLGRRPGTLGRVDA